MEQTSDDLDTMLAAVRDALWERLELIRDPHELDATIAVLRDLTPECP